MSKRCGVLLHAGHGMVLAALTDPGAHCCCAEHADPVSVHAVRCWFSDGRGAMTSAQARRCCCRPPLRTGHGSSRRSAAMCCSEVGAGWLCGPFVACTCTAPPACNFALTATASASSSWRLPCRFCRHAAAVFPHAISRHPLPAINAPCPQPLPLPQTCCCHPLP